MKNYTYQEALKTCEAYFGNELSARATVDKYLLRDNDGNLLEKSPDDIHRRIASEFARIESKKFKKPMSEEDIDFYLKNFSRIIPQGSPMSGIGNKYQFTSLSNCYVLTEPFDSYAGIMYTDEELVNISKRRGGVGINLDNLRPSGAPTKNSSRTSTGIVAFAKRYSNSIREVGQGGRRGAMMLTLDVHHPQILDFIGMKADGVSVTGANISVKLRDKFLKAVKDNTQYEQRWPVNSDTPKISLMESAKLVWNEIIKNAWDRAEPGILFWDTILRESPADCYSDEGFGSVSTNPCLSPSTLIALADGRQALSIEQLAEEGKDVPVYSVNRSTGLQEIKIAHSPRLTGEKVEVWKLIVGYGDTPNGEPLIATPNHKIILADCSSCELKDLKVGQEIFSHYRSPNLNVISLEFYGYDDVYNISVEDNENYYIVTSLNNYSPTTEGSFYTGFLVSNCSEIPLSVLDCCRLMFINLFTYVIKPFTSEARFDYKTFYHDAQIAQRLQDDLIDLEIESIDRIIHKIKHDPEPLFIKHNELELWKKVREACVNGRRTGTGITALGDTLAALGLKYDSDAAIDETGRIYQTLKFGVYRASVDLAKELGAFPVWSYEKEKDNPFLNRIKDEQIWLGKYATVVGFQGLYPRYDDDWEKMEISGAQLYEDMKTYGRRNIAALTTAPVGTGSMVSPLEYVKDGILLREYGTTSGIEPLFMKGYTRKKKGNHNDDNFRIDFTDPSGDTWMEFKIFHAGVKVWMDITGETDENKSPYAGSCAEELDWLQRVRLQAAAQRHVDHAISSTLNLPVDVSVEKVGEIYQAAWEHGLKGITVYRSGCRTGVLVENKQKKSTIQYTDAPTRPKELACDVYHPTVKGQSYFVLVGLIGDNQPYEVWAGRNGLLDKKIKTGRIIKIKKGFYKAILDDGTELSPVTLGCDENEESVSRLISIALRHGTPIAFLLEQISRISGDVNNFSKSIGRALKHYVKDGTKSGEDCPECNTKLIFQSGCSQCPNCSFSKC